MRVASLFIEPNSLSTLAKVPGRGGSKQLATVEMDESKNYWASLKGTETKHVWIKDVKECINRLIGNKICIPASYHLEQVMERFADKMLLPHIHDLTDEYEFGVQILSKWINITPEAVEDDTILIE